MPKISVIMPVYKAEKYIKKSIECILNQTYKDFELILIDDCGEDQSIRIAEKYQDPRIRIIYNEKNMGIAYSRNAGIRNSTGDYIALMDDDDLCPNNRFDIQNTFLDSYPQIDVLGGRCQMIDENDNIIKIFSERLYNPDYIKAYLMLYDPIANGSAMIRRKFMIDNGIVYKDDCLGMEDYLFWIDCSLRGKITNVNDILLSWRNSSHNETNKTKNNNPLERKKKLCELRGYALKENGFVISNDDLQFLNSMFPEDMRKTEASKNDLEKLYNIFRRLLIQSENNEISNKIEIRIFFKKMFSYRLENSEWWNLEGS